MKKGCLVILFFFWVTALFAADDNLEIVQRNLLELQQQFWNLEKSLKSNSTEFQNTARRLQTTTEELRESQAALNAKLETVLNQIQALNEKLDDTNRRIKELGTSRPVNPSIPQDTQNVPGNNQPAIAEPGNSGSPVLVAEQQIFQAARAEYTRGRFEQALRGFQDLLDQYSKSPFADDAQFMIGESYYGMREYVDAVTEYDKVIKEYSDSDHVPGARLKKAFSLQALGKKGQAVMELQTIVARYPTTKEAQIARQRLAEFGLE